MALALAGALVMPLMSAVSELHRTNQAEVLARADGLLFNATQEMRLSRGNTQAFLQTQDDPTADMNRVRAEVEARVTDTVQQVMPLLTPTDAAHAAGIIDKWRATEPLYKQMLALAAQPRGQRDLKETLPWYKAVGTVVDGLSDLSLSIAAAARMSDPVIGEAVLARQYSWGMRESMGDECSAMRSVFSGTTPMSPEMRAQAGTMRAVARKSLGYLRDLLAGTDAPAALVAATDYAAEEMTKGFAARDAAYATVGTAHQATRRHSTRRARCR